jgi:hypothetical protein
MQPALSAFKANVSDRLSKGQSVLDCQDLLDTLARSGAISDWMRRELGELHDAPDSEAIAWASGERILLAEPRWSLHLKRYDRGSPNVFSLPYLGAFTVIAGQLDITLFELGDSFDHAVFDRAQQLGVGVHQSLRPGDSLVVDGSRHAIRVDVREPTLALRLFSEPIHDLQWQFDSASRSPVAAISARELDSELVSLAKLLGALGDPSAIDVLLELTSHPRHFVRWTALQALGLVDGEQAGQRLQDFVHDRHPEVAAIASKMVARQMLQSVG